MNGLPKKSVGITSNTGEFVLEYIFHKYSTIWLREHAISAVQYEKARKEIELLKYAAKRTGEETQKRHVAADRHSPAVDDGMVYALRSENEKLKREIKRNRKLESSSVHADQRNAKENEELKKVILESKRKIAHLKERKAQVTAYADIEGKEKDSQIANLREHLEKAREDIETLKRRLSKLAGDKLQDGNPDIPDLSDPHRPAQLATYFSEIYDNEWSDAFEALPKDANEEKKARLLHGIVEMAFQFCEDTFNEQTREVRNILLAEDEDSGSSDTTLEDTSNDQPSGRNLVQTVKTLSIANELKALRKTLALQTAANIARKYSEEKMILQFVTGFGLSSKDINNKVKRYAGRCAELSWLMVTCDPPMCLSEGNEDQPFDADLYRPFTYRSEKYLSESVIKFRVWPALKLHLGGPVVAKGVAQAGEKGLKKLK